MLERLKSGNMSGRSFHWVWNVTADDGRSMQGGRATGEYAIEERDDLIRYAMSQYKSTTASCPLCHGEVETVDGYGARTASADAYVSCTCCGALWDSVGSYEAQAGIKAAQAHQEVWEDEMGDLSDSSYTRIDFCNAAETYKSYTIGYVYDASSNRCEWNVYTIGGYEHFMSGAADGIDRARVEAQMWIDSGAADDTMRMISSSAFDEAHNTSATDWLVPLAEKVARVQNERSIEADVEAFLDTLSLDQLSSADFTRQAAAEVLRAGASEPIGAVIESMRRNRYARYVRPILSKERVEEEAYVPHEGLFTV
jgi:hypothetical protein